MFHILNDYTIYNKSQTDKVIAPSKKTWYQTTIHKTGGTFENSYVYIHPERDINVNNSNTRKNITCFVCHSSNQCIRILRNVKIRKTNLHLYNYTMYFCSCYWLYE